MHRSIALRALFALGAAAPLGAPRAAAGAPPVPPDPPPATFPSTPSPDPATSASSEPAPSPCIESFGQAQRLRREGRLRASADELTRCGAATCPPAIVTKCVGWLTEVRAAMPTIVVSVRETRGGADVPDAVVFIDEESRGGASGRTLDLDPGPHKIRAASGERIARASIVVREGEKLRVVDLVLDDDHLDPSPRAAPAAPRPRDDVAEPGGPTISPLVFVGFGFAAVAGGIGIGAGAAALGEASSLEDTCGGTVCDEAQRGDYQDGVTLANVSTGAFVLAGVGLALGGVGVALTLIDTEDASASVGPGGAHLRGRF